MSADWGPGKTEDREEGQFLSGSPYMSHLPSKSKAKKLTSTSLERAIDERNQAQHFLSLLEAQLEAQDARLSEEQHREVELQEQMHKKRGMNQYQMAFLMIQKAMGVLVKACRGNHDKVLTYSFQLWKTQSAGRRNKVVYQTQAALKDLQSRLRSTLISFKNSQNKTLFPYFRKWQVQISLSHFKSDFDKKREIQLQNQQKELHASELEIERLASEQPALEQRISNLMQSEKTYKDTIVRLRGEREAIGANRAHLEAENREQNRAQEVRLERRLEDLERENQELQEKMTALENNVVFFIKEMSGLIDFQENLRADKNSPAQRGARPSDKRPDRRTRHLNLDF